MRRPLLVCVLLTSCLLTLLPFASATWSANVSGLASARTTTVNPGHAPSVGVSGNTVRLVWEPSTLASSAPVTGYLVKRYDAAGTEQVVGSGSCAATVGTTTCSETAVPDGSWRYSVTPVHHSWRGAESVTSPAEVAAAPSTTVTFPSVGTPYNDAGFTAGCGTGTTGEVCGTVADAGSGVTRVQVSLQRGTGSYWGGTGFTSDTEVLLDATGTTAWSYGFDPTTFPSDGRYTLRVRAVDGAGIVGVASSTFTVDRTPPAAPTIDSAPPSPTTSTTATFGFSNAEAGVAFECRLDGSAWAGCTSPTSYSGLANGSHTFEVRSVDAAGNLGNARSHTWVVDTVAPSAAITFPANGSFLSDFNAGCGTASTGDVCGTSADTGGTGVAQVQVSLQQGTGSYWNGTGFTSSTEVLLDATGTTSWSYPFSATSFPTDGQYTLRARVTDAAGNTTTTSTTFTIDRTSPTGVDVQATNGTRLVSTVDEGDTVTLTYSERIAPGSVLAGWSGAQTNVVVRLSDVFKSNDTLTFYNAADSSQLPLGVVDLGRGDYTNKNVTSLPSTMTQTGNSISFVLGARPLGSGGADTALGGGTMVWTPASGAADLANNPAATTAVTESGAADSDF